MLHWNEKGFGSKYEVQGSFILDIRELEFQVDCPVSSGVPNCTEMIHMFERRNQEVSQGSAIGPRFPRSTRLFTTKSFHQNCILA